MFLLLSGFPLLQFRFLLSPSEPLSSCRGVPADSMVTSEAAADSGVAEAETEVEPEPEPEPEPPPRLDLGLEPADPPS